ncbi:aldose epimerase [Crocosphaera sp. XPORK-15E]|uniref:aldose epimerase family protein n=1 Tax=Crocosphaera sp. XPORK-15E TaxID=3110247 RepID=UPI002B1F148D|nr:aldose epimerase [Crocosphaera sp. XPORK-15E]MEA5534493.1 aldose epimerase [Crocosphaera sp. XPORK-15E]
MAFSISVNPKQYSTYILSDDKALSRLEVVPERGGIITRWAIQGQEILSLDEERFTNPELSVRGGVPILFPICGNLPDNTYVYQGKTYTLKQHGFARDLPWEVIDQSTSSCASLTLSLSSNDKTLNVYPFKFQLKFTYELEGKILRIRQQYINKSDKIMPFSFGFHPYFLVKDKTKLAFDIPSSAYQEKSSTEIVPFEGNFDFDADEIDVAFKSLTRSSASMTDHQRGLKLTLNWSDSYSTFVFWTLKGKDYICLEPWSAPRNAIATGENLTELDPGASCEALIEMNVASI